MSFEPTISIIVPNFNHSNYLQERLESIFNQTFQDFEVILLDDASSDGSPDILEKYSKHPKVSQFIKNKENSGVPFKQWQKGLKLAKGEFIWIAESDDYCDNMFLESLYDIYRSNSEIGFAYCQSQKIDSMGNITGSWEEQTATFEDKAFSSSFQLNGKIFIEKFLIFKNVIPNVSSALIRKSAWDSILPLEYKPYMKYNADWFYYLQLLCDQNIAFLSDSLNFYRHHDMSVIAKAIVLDGYKMEIETRRRFIQVLQEKKLSNEFSIVKANKAMEKELKYLIAVKSKNLNKFKGITKILPYPKLLWRFIIKGVKHTWIAK